VQPHQNGLNGSPSAPPSAGLAAPASFGQAQSQSASPAPQQEGESEFIKCVSLVLLLARSRAARLARLALRTPQAVADAFSLSPRRSWREKQAQEIAAREEEYARRKEETIAKARNDIDNFYKEYNAKKEKAIAQNKCVPLPPPPSRSLTRSTAS